VVLGKSEFPEVHVRVLGADVNVRRGSGLLEQPPERLDIVDAVQRILPVVVPPPRFLAVLDGAVAVAATAQ